MKIKVFIHIYLKAQMYLYFSARDQTLWGVPARKWSKFDNYILKEK